MPRTQAVLELMRLLSATIIAYILSRYQQLKPATNSLYNISHCSDAPITGAANKATSLSYNQNLFLMVLPKSFPYVPALLYTNEATFYPIGGYHTRGNEISTPDLLSGSKQEGKPQKIYPSANHSTDCQQVASNRPWHKNDHIFDSIFLLLRSLGLWHIFSDHPLSGACSPDGRFLNCKSSQASHMCADSDWLYKTSWVMCQYAPSQGIVPKLHKHLSSENVQTQHQYPGGILDDSWI